MKLIINGEERVFEGLANVAELIDKLGIKGDRVAVELNREIVPRAQWAESALKDEDRLEVVHFVGGGTAFTEDDVDEIIRLGKHEGARAIQSWVRNNKNTRSHEFEVIYRALKVKSLPTAVAFAYGIPKSDIPSVALKDMDELRKMNPGLWFSGILNVLSPALLRRAKAALDSGDILCGMQRHYCFGSGPSPVAFMSFSSYERHVRTTRPGDELMLVSVKRFADENLLIEPSETAIKTS